MHDPPEVHEVTGVVRLPVDGAVLHHVVDVPVENGVFHQLTRKKENVLLDVREMLSAEHSQTNIYW